MLFDLVVIVDWSAAATRGPAKPSPDRCWIAWGDGERRPEAEYLRTRLEAEHRIAELVGGTAGNVLVAWDFPFGYPHGAGLGGGRPLAAMLDGLIDDRADGANNRFEVAADLNRRLGNPPGPFWGCPTKAAGPDLTEKKQPFDAWPFGEYRIVDRRVRAESWNIQSAWKLYTTGSVGSQVLMGLPTVYRLATRPGLAGRSRIWPFETGWDRALDGIVHAEMWPSLSDHDAQNHPIKDARQVQATRDWALDSIAEDRFRQAFAKPDDLSDAEAEICGTEEGWILGFGHGALLSD